MDALDQLRSAWERVRPWLRRIEAEPTGRDAALTVLAVCAVASAVAWIPLTLVWGVLSALTPAGDCRGTGEPLRTICAFKVAALTVAVPVLVLAAMYAARGRVIAWIERQRARVPAEAEFLAAPLGATLFFALVWSGTHFSGASGGLLPDPVFPAVIGLFTYAIARFGHAIDDQVARIRLPATWSSTFIMRLAIAGPLILLIVLGSDQRGLGFGARQQLVVLLALATAYIATRRMGGAGIRA